MLYIILVVMMYMDFFKRVIHVHANYTILFLDVKVTAFVIHYRKYN